MRLIRTKRSWGGWLALFALGLQLTLSFGHIHAEDFAAAPAAVAAQDHSAGQDAPDGDHHRSGHDDCAICAVMHLAGASLLPTSPAVALPPIVTHIALAAAAQAALPPAARQPFQARAPPSA